MCLEYNVSSLKAHTLVILSEESTEYENKQYKSIKQERLRVGAGTPESEIWVNCDI